MHTLDFGHSAFDTGHFQLLAEGSWANVCSIDNSRLHEIADCSYVCNIDNSRLHEQSAHAFSLCMMPCLQSLSAKYSHLKADGFAHVASMKLPMLQSLNLAGNKINSKAMVKMQAADWPALVFLDLRYNLIDKHAIMQLVRDRFPFQSWSFEWKQTQQRSNLPLKCKQVAPQGVEPQEHLHECVQPEQAVEQKRLGLGSA